MLSQTSELAIRVVTHLGLRGDDQPVSLRLLARQIYASPSYMAKVCGLLAKGNILRARKGSAGGVFLARPPSEISLLEVVEACQGKILGDFCDGVAEPEQVCAYHRAMLELHEAIVGTLQRWTLADLLAKPYVSDEIADAVDCRMGKPPKWGNGVNERSIDADTEVAGSYPGS